MTKFQEEPRLRPAVKAERSARYAADRVTWSRAGEPRWLQDASITDQGRAWGAAAGWADSDPSAARAADRVEQRLRTVNRTPWPTTTRPRKVGADRITAMRDVFNHRATSPAAAARMFVAEPVQAASTGSNAAADRKRSAADLAAEGFPEPSGTVTTQPPQSPLEPTLDRPRTTKALSR